MEALLESKQRLDCWKFLDANVETIKACGNSGLGKLFCGMSVVWYLLTLTLLQGFLETAWVMSQFYPDEMLPWTCCPAVWDEGLMCLVEDK